VGLPDGNFVNPIITEGIQVGSLSWHEEFFGPVFNLFQVDSADEAI
jgi:acyl-CoA reductase-like NAD-dependent aldehyde dehydrogenase